MRVCVFAQCLFAVLMFAGLSDAVGGGGCGVMCPKQVKTPHQSILANQLSLSLQAKDACGA